jgi:hypothetical protein
MTTTLEQRAAQAKAPDFEANLVLISFTRKKGTGEQPGINLKFTAPLEAAAVTRDNEFDPKRPEHGLLKITSRNLFEGERSLVVAGKLTRKFYPPAKETPAYQIWMFRAQNFPDDKGWVFLSSLARVAGDDDQALVMAEFRVKEQVDDDEAKGPELFSSPDPELDENDKALLAKPVSFAEGPNVVPDSTAEHMVKNARKRKSA